jgi:hypothetical protein
VFSWVCFLEEESGLSFTRDLVEDLVGWVYALSRVGRKQKRSAVRDDRLPESVEPDEFVSAGF